jgi:hypothetical protein
MNPLLKIRAWNSRTKMWEYGPNNEIDSIGLNGLNKDCVPCRNTGYKDKNNIEIYQNDIVSYKDTLGLVSFIDGEFVLYYNRQTDSCLIRLIKPDDIEVVGTIFDFVISPSNLKK